MKRFGTRSLSRQLLKEREREAAEEKKKEEKKVDLEDVRKRTKGMEIPTTMLSKHEYAAHKKARDGMAAAVGTSSERLYRKFIDEAEFKRVQVEGAKRAIRETNLFIARRAYLELLMHHLLTIPGRNINGIPIKFQPLVDFWHEFYGGPQMIVDEVPKEKPKKKRPVRTAKAKKEAVDERETGEETKS